MSNFNNDWDVILKKEIYKQYFLRLKNILDKEYENKIIYPPKDKIFTSLILSSFENTKIIILGQDPYHGVNQANGLAFSVNNIEKKPPSLINILKEVRSDIGETIIKTGDLTPWTKQGVLLLNSVLTVRSSTPYSHKNIGWETFTDCIIKKLNQKDIPIIFILWGAKAIDKQNLITNQKHLVLKSPHPSPLSAYRGFFGNKHFSKSNNFLIKNNMNPIKW
ncbi:MAG: uracil-DNA glycosylase [Oscillospiraceae bacterium]|nr:uracil-DNA glycosylase [Oscillospiraceae bacterium]